MKLFAGIIVWLLAMLARFVFIVIGWFFVPLTLVADGAERTPPLWRPVYGNVEDIPEAAKKNRWTKYVEMAWRNPTTGLDSLFTQPLWEVKPNPDDVVRSGARRFDQRFMQAGLFWEYWFLYAIKNGPWKGRYFEFRIGWKFVDGNEDFTPTIQFGPKK